MNKTAILIDGGFYRKIAYREFPEKDPKPFADALFNYCMRHLTEKKDIQHRLYRIFYYDCLPSAKKVYHPLLKRTVDLSQSDTYQWMTQFIDELKKKRKIAIRLGKISDTNAHYNLNPDITKKIIAGNHLLTDIAESNFQLQIEQKGVDMKIGLDIASIAYKKQADQIVLISGDSDFVPAAKLARREGIDFILDPMYTPIKPDLFEHIDGLRSCFSKKNSVH